MSSIEVEADDCNRQIYKTIELNAQRQRFRLLASMHGSILLLFEEISFLGISYSTLTLDMLVNLHSVLDGKLEGEREKKNETLITLVEHEKS